MFWENSKSACEELGDLGVSVSSLWYGEFSLLGADLALLGLGGRLTALLLVLPLLTRLCSMESGSTTVNGYAAKSLLLDENSKVFEEELI